MNVIYLKDEINRNEVKIFQYTEDNMLMFQEVIGEYVDKFGEDCDRFVMSFDMTLVKILKLDGIIYSDNNIEFYAIALRDNGVYISYLMKIMMMMLYV